MKIYNLCPTLYLRVWANILPMEPCEFLAVIPCTVNSNF